ncbi:sodium:alanine symporter family protein [Oscillospiraceae bacterium MB08-C2-2]|nr:sodium:alanine symporter family protein [Oscillospiraceae bacterium MB08-C2-2]
MFLAQWIERLAGSALVNGTMVFLLCGLGVYLTVKTGFFQFRKAPEIIRKTFGTLWEKPEKTEKGISPFQAMTTALAGTMGVGNIAGVATAIVAGGPGAIFWMWVTGFFGMMTKYAEIFLAVKFRQKNQQGRYVGGPMYYMEKPMGKKGLAVIFSVVCIAASLGSGNMTQVNSVATAMADTFGISPLISGIGIAVITGMVILGGLKRIGKVTEAVIPLISVAYLAGAGMLLYLNREQLPAAFRLIFTEAFRLRAAGGGVAGYTIMQAFRFGTVRGIFTNEAGMGSAPMAHAAADCKSPRIQAMWGIGEIFLDTILFCTVTALVLLTAGGGTLWLSGEDGAPLTALAFESTFGPVGGVFLTLSLVFFAVATLLGWSYYGECAVVYLAGDKAGKELCLNIYRLLFLLVAVGGAVSSLKTVWLLADLLNVVMAVPNVIAIIVLRRHVLKGIKKE